MANIYRILLELTRALSCSDQPIPHKCEEIPIVILCKTLDALQKRSNFYNILETIIITNVAAWNVLYIYPIHITTLSR